MQPRVLNIFLMMTQIIVFGGHGCAMQYSISSQRWTSLSQIPSVQQSAVAVVGIGTTRLCMGAAH